MFNPHARWDRALPGDGSAARQPVTVVVRFAQGKVAPLCFFLGGSRYAVTRLEYSWSERNGKNPRYYFSVSDARDTYCLCFDVEAMAWYLVPRE